MNNHFESQEEHGQQRYLTPGGKNKVGKIYKQFYRKAWEEIPEFKEWLTSIPGERSKAYCKICERSLHAHRLSLTKHTVSLKHMRLAQRKAQENNMACYDDESIEMNSVIETKVELDEEQNSVEEEYQMLTNVAESNINQELVCESEEITIGGSGGQIEEHHLQQLRDEQQREEEEELTEPQVIYTTEDTHLVYDSKQISTHSDGVSLIKIVQKKKNEKPHISTHVIDISKGMPVAGLSVSLYQLIDGRWMLLSEGTTNGDGRWGEGTLNCIKAGRFKLHYDTERYFLLRHQPTFYPFVEVVFDMCSPNDRYHLPLILGPHGFTTYKGC